MNLLNPWFLAGAAAIGLPLWLHLLERENPIRLPFSSLMLFEKRTQRTFFEKRFRYLLLLALRLALLLLVAFAFAKPVWERPPTALVSGLPSLQLIVLDTSLSMNYAGRWERAREAARSAVERMGPADRGQILTTGPSVSIITEALGRKAELISAIESLAPGSSRNSYGDVVEAVRSLAGEGETPVEVHLISDFQNSAMPTRFSDLVLPSAAALHVHDVSDPADQNWAIESVKGVTRTFGAKRTRLEAVVSGFSSVPARRTVTLKINGETVASQSHEVPAMGRASFVFEGFVPPPGFSRAELTLTPADELPRDDRRIVALDNSEPEPILFVTGDRRRRDALYFESALSSSASSAFRVHSSSSGEAERLKPEDFALVVLSDTANLSASFLDRLKRWAEAGGAVLIALGPKIAARGAVPLSGHRVAASPMPSGAGTRYQTAGEIDEAHAALARVERFRGVKFFRYARIAVGEEDEVPARLGDSSPLLVERPIGRGRVMLFASSLDNVWNDLPVHPVFVPFVVESARYLGGRESARAQATLDSLLELGRGREARSMAQVFDPAGGRVLSLSETVAQSDVVLDQVGFYEIREAGSIELVAVNPDARESNLRAMDEETIELWKSTGRRGASFAASGEESTIKPPPIRIWRLLLLLALLIGLIESVVGNRHLIIRREA